MEHTPLSPNQFHQTLSTLTAEKGGFYKCFSTVFINKDPWGLYIRGSTRGFRALKNNFLQNMLINLPEYIMLFEILFSRATQKLIY